MDTEKLVKLKRGYLHILPDKIVITKDGVIRKSIPVNLHYSKFWIYILYLVIILGLSWVVFSSYQKGDQILPFVFAFFGIFLIYQIHRSLSVSKTNIIDRYRIVKVEYRSGFSGLVRPSFVVYFEDDHKVVKRRILLPELSKSGTQSETEKAMMQFKQEQYL